jgi:hypothetical protein
MFRAIITVITAVMQRASSAISSLQTIAHYVVKRVLW